MKCEPRAIITIRNDLARAGKRRYAFIAVLAALSILTHLLIRFEVHVVVSLIRTCGTTGRQALPLPWSPTRPDKFRVGACPAINDEKNARQQVRAFGICQ